MNPMYTEQEFLKFIKKSIIGLLNSNVEECYRLLSDPDDMIVDSDLKVFPADVENIFNPNKYSVTFEDNYFVDETEKLYSVFKVSSKVTGQEVYFEYHLAVCANCNDFVKRNAILEALEHMSIVKPVEVTTIDWQYVC